MARTRSQSREPSIEPRLVHRQARTVGEGTARNARQAQQRKSCLLQQDACVIDFRHDSELSSMLISRAMFTDL